MPPHARQRFSDGKMGVTGGRLDLRVSQQFADHGQALAERQRAGSERVTEVVNSHPVESGAGSDTPPGVLQVGEVPALFAARDHPRIVLIAGQGGQQPHGGGNKRNCSPANLGRAHPVTTQLKHPSRGKKAIPLFRLHLSAQDIGTDTIGDPGTRGLDGLIRQMGVAGGCLYLCVKSMHAAVPATLNCTAEVSITPTAASRQSTLIKGSRTSAPEGVLPGRRRYATGLPLSIWQTGPVGSNACRNGR